MAIGAGTDIAIESSDIVLIGDQISSIADVRDIATSSYTKTKQNLAIAFVFNGIGVRLAVTGIVGPVWAMIAMITSVTPVLANSFGTRLRPTALPSAIRNLRRWIRKTLGGLDAGQFRRFFARYETRITFVFGTMSFALGALWVVVLDNPGL